jgi:predicted amidohydrolase YtcJ
VPCCPPIESLDEARRQVRRLKALGATSIKQYALLRREQQQWVVQACRDEGLVVTTHTLQRAYTQMVTAMDGHTGLEHAIQAAPLYKDMLSVFAKTGVFYAPTLVASGRADTYFQERQNVHDDEKLRRFTPHARLEGSRRLTIMPESEYPVHAEARVAADLVRAGGKVVMGSHGINREGLGAHWEIRSFVMGGMTPLQALRAATRDAAASLGMERDLGSLAPGLLADLLVLDANPLEDIKHTEQIRYVMKGGVLWRGDTLDQVWPDSRGTGSSSAPR